MADGIQTDVFGPYLVKDPRSRLDIEVDWTDFLESETTSIASSAWDVTSGMTKSNEATDSGISTVIIAGGTAGSTYVLRNTITCANGLIDSRSIRVIVKDR